MKHTLQYLWSTPTQSQPYRQFSPETFDLKSPCSTAASCSWSRNNVASFHHAVLCCKSPVHPLSVTAMSVWLAASDPGLQKYIEVLQIICQARSPTTSVQHIWTKRLVKAAFVVDAADVFPGRQSVWAEPGFTPDNRFNVGCCIRAAAGLWHLVSTISQGGSWIYEVGHTHAHESY